MPIDVTNLDVDLLAAPGHKGLLGPLGTGVLYIRHGVERELKPLRCGGTGTQSDEDRQPDELPDKYEPGNHNLAGLAGLAAATDFLRQKQSKRFTRIIRSSPRAFSKAFVKFAASAFTARKQIPIARVS